MVLATDFGLHVKILSEFKMMVGKEVPVDAEGTAANVAAPTTYRLRKHGLPVFTAKATTMTDVEQLTVASMIIKVADLSYPTKGFDYSMIWLERFLVMIPSVWMSDDLPIGVGEILMPIGFGGIMVLLVMWVLSKIPAAPVTDKMFSENDLEVHVHPSHGHNAAK